MTAIPVKDVDQARRFCEGWWDSSSRVDHEPTAASNTGAGAGAACSPIRLTENAGISPATLAAWHVDDIEAKAKALRDKDVLLEEYDLPALRRDGIAMLPGARAIWFKDPDGNILNVFERD